DQALRCTMSTGADVSAACVRRRSMAPYEADRHKKEKDALKLIIGMKKQQETSSSSGQIIFFVVMPLILALVIMRFREIQVFAQQNKQVSAVIKMFYPAWKRADDFPVHVVSAVESNSQKGAPGHAGTAELPAQRCKKTWRD